MSDIQRKLERIDRQLSGGFVNSYKRLIATCPLLFAAIGLIAGILIRDRFDLSASFWTIVLVICAILAVFIFITRTFASYKLLLLSFCAVIGFTCLGAIRLDNFNRLRPNDISNFVGEQRKLATIRGSVITRPYVNRNNGWEFVKFKHSDPTGSFYLKVRKVKTIDGWAKATGIVRVQVNEALLDLKEGDYIQAYCWLDRFKSATNPGQFDLARHLARRNIFVAASVKSRNSIQLFESQGKGYFTRIRGKFREIATSALLGDSSIEERNHGLLEALLLGYRGKIDSDTYRAFHKTGLLHFISLSGLHLGILAGIVWWLCKTAGLLKRGRAIICIIALSVFLMIVPPRAPTLRAAIIVFIFCISFFFRRRPDPLNTLSLAAIVLLLIKPTGLFGAGWQLSFASVLGIILFTDRINFFLYEKITDSSAFEKIRHTGKFPQILSGFGIYLINLLAISLGAWLGGAGFVLYHFYMINPFTSLWKLAMFPLVGLILTVGYMKIILSFLLPSIAAVLGAIVSFLSALMIWMVEHISALHIGNLDLSQILIGHIPAAVVVLYYCFVLFAFFVHFRRPLIKKAICTATILILIAFLGVTKWQRTHRNSLIMTCLDIGHGQAILVQLPGGDNILFDAGSMYKDDIGRRIVTPFLDYSGISRIDSIIISHDDLDHINGIPEIVEHCGLGGVYTTDAFLLKTDSGGTAKYLMESLTEKGFEIGNLEDFDPETAAEIKILWPSEQICQDEQLSDNNKSIVCLIEFAGRKILLCSDIEKLAQAELLRLNPNLKIDYLVVPHHGSSRTLDKDFPEKLGAKVLICSCSRSDCEKNRVIKPGGNSKCFYTGEHGTVVVCVDRDGTIR